MLLHARSKLLACFADMKVTSAKSTTKTLRQQLCNMRRRSWCEFKCNDCDSVYVGETGRQLEIDMNEYKGTI